MQNKQTTTVEATLTKAQIKQSYLEISNRLGRWAKRNELGRMDSNLYFHFENRSIRRLALEIIKERPDEITFEIYPPPGVDRAANAAFYHDMVEIGLKRGSRVTREEIVEFSKLPKYRTVTPQSGLSAFTTWAKKHRPEYDKLPNLPKLKKGENLWYSDEEIAKKYIEKCLKKGEIIVFSSDETNTLGIYGMGNQNLYSRFGGIRKMREYCADLDPEFKKLLEASA